MTGGLLILGITYSATQIVHFFAAVSLESFSLTCTPARILYFNLQPSLYGRDGELTEAKEVKEMGFDITVKNHDIIPTIGTSTLEPYNVLWLHSGCGGESYPLRDSEIAVIKSFYLKGGSLIIDAGNSQGGGVYGPKGSDCQYRANQIATNLGVTFSGTVQYAQSTDSCRPIQAAGSPLLTDVTKIFRESSGEMKLGSAVAWGGTKPVFAGTIDTTGAPVLAVIAKEKGHGGAIFSPQDQGLQTKCSGKAGAIYNNIFTYLGHPPSCEAPKAEIKTVDIANGSCVQIEKPLYASGAIRIPCPANTAIMGGGWYNGTADMFDYSRPLEVGVGWECQGNLKDPTGKCYAICCDGNQFESIVVTRAGELSDRLTPTCSRNYQLVGGGFYDATSQKDEEILRPATEADGWTCYDDDSKAQGGGQCSAVCARRKVGDVLSCQTVTAVGAQDKSLSVWCPAGTFVTGGGFEDPTTTNNDQDGSYPTPGGDGWTCQKDGNTAMTGTGASTCFARCCPTPAPLPAPAPKSSKSSSSTALLSSASSDSSAALIVVASSIATSSSSVVAPSSAMASEQSSSALPPVSAAPATSASSSIAPPSSATIIPIALSTSSAAPSSISSSSDAMLDQSSSSAAPATVATSCDPAACALAGDAYCSGFGLGCATIADQPCFVCVASPAAVNTVSASSRPPTILSLFVVSSAPAPRSSSSALPLSSSMITPQAAPAAPTPLTATISPLAAPAVTTHPAAHAPLGATGPGALAVMIGGAAAGWGWMQRRQRRNLGR